jgi:hypothetical protein
MSKSKQAILFDDIFEVTTKDKDGNKFDKGSYASIVAVVPSPPHDNERPFVQYPGLNAKVISMRWISLWT